ETAPAGIDRLNLLFVNGNLPALDAENLEKIVVEALAFALFVMGILPFFAERFGSAFDLIPAKPHRIPPFPDNSLAFATGTAKRGNVQPTARSGNGNTS